MLDRPEVGDEVRKGRDAELVGLDHLKFWRGVTAFLRKPDCDSGANDSIDISVKRKNQGRGFVNVEGIASKASGGTIDSMQMGFDGCVHDGRYVRMGWRVSESTRRCIAVQRSSRLANATILRSRIYNRQNNGRESGGLRSVHKACSRATYGSWSRRGFGTCATNG